MIPHRKTSDSMGHTHTINNPQSDWTDPAEDGHRHQLSSGCSACELARRTLKWGIIPTRDSNFHHHFFNVSDLFR